MHIHWVPCMKLHGAPGSFRSVTREYCDSGHVMPGWLCPLLGRKKYIGRASPHNLSFFTWSRFFCVLELSDIAHILSTVSACDAQCRPRRHFSMAPK
eukprot:8130284-Pyramimonas_sp.AAC.1